MILAPAYSRARDILLQDACARDLATARRAGLLEILWDERYLTRAQLMARLELRLGRGCFGTSAWQDTFYRDMRVVKRALVAAGYPLAYSRDEGRPGYYLKGQPSLSPELTRLLEGSAAEADARQIDIYKRLSTQARFRQGCSISDTARQAVVYRIRQENPGLSLAEASRIALERAYSHA